MTRRLSAILFADIVEFSKQMSLDEAAGLAMRSRVEDLIRASAAASSGRVVKSIGDAVMLDFDSSVNAVHCALDIQQRMQSLNESLPSEQPVHVRVGVHAGDVAEEGGDLFGNAVNIASRLVKVATPGGICISREVQLQVHPVLPLQCLPVSLEARHNIPEPVEAFLVQTGNESATGTASRSVASAPPDRPHQSIVKAPLGVSAAEKEPPPPTLLQLMTVPYYQRKRSYPNSQPDSGSWILGRAGLYSVAGAILLSIGTWLGQHASFQLLLEFLFRWMSYNLWLFAAFNTLWDYRAASAWFRDKQSRLTVEADIQRVRWLMEPVSDCPEPIKAALERAKSADRGILIISAQPSWKRAGIAADGYRKQSHAQLLALLEWGQHLSLVAQQISVENAGRPEWQEIASLYERQCACLEAAVGMFEKAEAAIMRASLAVSPRSQAGQAPEEALREMVASFDALAEIVETQAELPDAARLKTLGEKSGGNTE